MQHAEQVLVWWHVIREFTGKALLGRERDRERGDLVDVIKHYDDVWRHSTPADRERRTIAGVVDNRLARVPLTVVRRTYLEHLCARLAPSKPRRVLEVGSGHGINVLNLSYRMPGTRFVGLELTGSGIAAAQWLEKNPITELAGHTSDSACHVEFVQGNGFSLPFRDGTFDCGFTCLTLEQLPNHWQFVVDELRRVVHSRCVFVEPFREAQTSPINVMHLWSRNYFRHSYGILEDRGFKVVEFSRLQTRHSPRFGVGVCVAEVK